MTLTNPRFPDWITEPGADTRNVIDHYKGWSNDSIRADLAANAFPLVVVAESFAHDFNISTVVRNCNAFGASKVLIAGRRRWDRRGAVGVHNYTPVEHIPDLTTTIADYRTAGYEIVAVDNIDGAKNLGDHTWQAKTLLVFGQEDIGVSNLTLRSADTAVAIKQYGTVRSLNVGTASGIVLNDYATRISLRAFTA